MGFREFLNENREETVYRILHNKSIYVEDLHFDDVKKFLGDNNSNEKEIIQSYNKADNHSDRKFKNEKLSIFK